MRRPPATSTFAYSFGPGPLTPAIKLLDHLERHHLSSRRCSSTLLRLRQFRPACPRDVLETRLRIWQPFTYMFLHGGIFHILFNMLALWMFGVELERMWGSRYFTKFYFVSGVGAALYTTLGLSFARSHALRRGLLPLADDWSLGRGLRRTARVRDVLSASPDLHVFRLSNPGEVLRPDHRRRSRCCLLRRRGGGGIAHTTHLGGLVAAYLYLKGGSRTHLMSEIKYQVPEVAYQPDAPPLRCLLWRPRQRRRPPRPLTARFESQVTAPKSQSHKAEVDGHPTS